jgi:hypothetical protein
MHYALGWQTLQESHKWNTRQKSVLCSLHSAQQWRRIVRGTALPNAAAYPRSTTRKISQPNFSFNSSVNCAGLALPLLAFMA